MSNKVIDIQGQINIIEGSGCGECISIGSHSFDIIRLVEYIIRDLELVGKFVSIRYWITPDLTTKEEAIEQHLRSVMGDVEGKWHAIYSEVTGYMVLEEDLVIGGHDLGEEIRNYEGEYLILELTVHDTD